MRVSSIAIIALVSSAISAPIIAVASDAAPISTSQPAPDHAAYLAGTWSCTTAQSNDTSITATVASDGTITMKGAVTSPQSTGTMTTADIFHFDTAANQWTLDSAPAGPFGAYYGTATPWTGSQWTFTGKEPLYLNNQWQTTDVRQVFTYLGSTVFRREFQAQAPQHYWRDFSEEVCTKAV